MGSSISGSLKLTGGYFSVGDLMVRPDQDLPDHLSEVPVDDWPDFLCAVFYTVLVDQIIYTHFRMDYLAFQALTSYPKFDRTVGWARAMVMANPYEVFSDDILSSRGLAFESVQERFQDWAGFIVRDLRTFFREHDVGTTRWEDVHHEMLADPDCTRGPLGAALEHALVKDSGATG
jgi:hypothetical protein